MKTSIVFDDIMDADPSLRDLLGVKQFGALLFQRRKRSDAMADIAHRAGGGFIHLQSAEDRDRLLDRLKSEDANRFYLHIPSHLAVACKDEVLVTLLRQIAYAPGNLHLPAQTRSRQGWSLLAAPLLRQLLLKPGDGAMQEFLDQHSEAIVEVRDRLHLIDIREERTLLDYLSGQMDARHFNAMVRDDYTITKRSTDRVKLKREFDFYQAVSPRMRMFLVQPFEFEDDGEVASYRMERLSIPDMAMQWVHGAFQPHEFELFLRHMFYFLENRPAKHSPSGVVAAVQEELYIGKVRRRVAELKALPAYQDLAPHFESAFSGIDALVRRYETLFAKARAQLRNDQLVIGHGDPCFSNILYSKTNQYLKLIDPRGGSSEDDLYTDPFYDVAKISHSVLGQYDFINQGKFEISVSDNLRPEVRIQQDAYDWARSTFLSYLESAGYNVKVIRLCEASLFISMLPLHIDNPRKVLGFALRGSSILDELAKTRTWGSNDQA